MRLDSHQHFWQYSPAEYGWINDEMGILKRDFLPRDLEPVLKKNGFDGCISVQARQDHDETLFLLDLAEQNDFVKGVVGWVDLCAPIERDQWVPLSGRRKLVGVRHVLQDEPDDEFMLRADFRRGIARLRERGLTYDLLLRPRHLQAAVKLVREFPEQPFVLDHIAKPEIAAGVLSPWEKDLRELARFENVWCKVSGMVTEAKWNAWQATDFHPYLDVVFEAFGPERLLIGSDWPVCTLSADYAATMGIVRDYLDQFPVAVQDQVLGGNCASFYGVK